MLGRPNDNSQLCRTASATRHRERLVTGRNAGSDRIDDVGVVGVVAEVRGGKRALRHDRPTVAAENLDDSGHQPSSVALTAMVRHRLHVRHDDRGPSRAVVGEPEEFSVTPQFEPARARRVGHLEAIGEHSHRPILADADRRWPAGENGDMPNDGISCMIMRGGTSKGAYFLADDLPVDPAERGDVLLRIMGSPDERQIDGIGGAHPLTSKVAVVRKSDRDDADVDYLFLQVSVDAPLVSDRQNCGNLLAGVGPFAVERGLVEVGGGSTASVRVYLVNTDSIATARFPVTDGVPRYDGTTTIDGVPGTAAAVELGFEGIAGGSCGALLPTGNVVDVIDDVEVTLIDNGMPVVVLRGSDVGITGSESPAELEADATLRRRLETIRLQAGPLMHLGDVTDTTVPKLTMVSAPTAGGDISTRTFIPHRCHDAIGVLGAVSVATAALLPGSPAARPLRPGAGTDGTVTCEHPTGAFTASVELDHAADPPLVRRAGIIRTARPLMDGVVFPRSTT